MSYENYPNGPLSDNTNTWYLIHGKFGNIGNYTKSPQLYKCPADKSYVIISGHRHPRVRSYSMNFFMGTFNHETGSRWAFKKLDDIKNPCPSKAFVFIDDHEDTIGTPAFTPSPFTREGDWYSLPASRHGGPGALSFADGHVESKKWVDPRTRKPDDRKPRKIMENQNNRDSRWLFERTTSVIGP